MSVVNCKLLKLGVKRNDKSAARAARGKKVNTREGNHLRLMSLRDLHDAAAKCHRGSKMIHNQCQLMTIDINQLPVVFSQSIQPFCRYLLYIVNPQMREAVDASRYLHIDTPVVCSEIRVLYIKSADPGRWQGGARQGREVVDKCGQQEIQQRFLGS